ncbi:hypothetical protein MYX06_04690 [Patescibacteria group bacterium AH-259-L05]|nr:hypothetical protein [Patescibacteria group bacterium AH-259-L05]
MKKELIEEIQNVIYASESLSDKEKEKYFKFFELLKTYPGNGIVLLLEKTKEELTSGDRKRFEAILKDIDRNLSLVQQGDINKILESAGL